MMETVDLHMLQICLQYVEELTSWMIQLILVDDYQDGMLSRMTTTSGGGGCKDLRSLARPPEVRTWVSARLGMRAAVMRWSLGYATICDDNKERWHIYNAWSVERYDRRPTFEVRQADM